MLVVITIRSNSCPLICWGLEITTYGGLLNILTITYSALMQARSATYLQTPINHQENDIYRGKIHRFTEKLH